MASSAIDAEPIYEEGNEIPGETEAASNYRSHHIHACSIRIT